MAGELKDVYIALNKLQTKIDERNKGDNPYYQFRYLWRTNGDSCQYLGLFAKQMPVEDFPEIENLVKAYREYVAIRDCPGLKP
jgi:hypothetical protein